MSGGYVEVSGGRASVWRVSRRLAVALEMSAGSVEWGSRLLELRVTPAGK